MVFGRPQTNPVLKVAFVVTSTNTFGSVQLEGGALQETIQGEDCVGLH
jgi:hypothetical protein